MVLFRECRLEQIHTQLRLADPNVASVTEIAMNKN